MLGGINHQRERTRLIGWLVQLASKDEIQRISFAPIVEVILKGQEFKQKETFMAGVGLGQILFSVGCVFVFLFWVYKALVYFLNLKNGTAGKPINFITEKLNDPNSIQPKLKKYCTKCGRKISDEGTFCEVCSREMNDKLSATNTVTTKAKKYCTKCGKLVEETDSFCKSCGFEMKPS